MSPLPGFRDRRQSLRGEFDVDLRINARVDRDALRRPPMDATVDAEIRSMVDYVREHGRGAVAERELALTAASSKQRSPSELARLDTAAMTLLPFLDLDSGPGELGRVALARLGAQLGDDAAIRGLSEDGSVSATDIVIQHRDGIAFIGFRALDKGMGDRFLAVLDGWMRGSPSTRAIILDVARCELVDPASAARVVNAFAPGRTAFALSFRNPDSGALEQRSWHGDADSGATVNAVTPVFVLTSSRTGSVAEAIAYALRHYSTARIFGGTTSGSGRVMDWVRLPWRAWFGFTVADLIGADGQSLKGRPVIPDACLGDQGMVPLSERTTEAYRAACPGAEREVPSALAIDYVRSLLASETRPGNAPPLQHGDKHG